MASEKDDISSLDSRLDSFLDALGPLSTVSSVARLVLELLAEDLSPSEDLKTIVRYDPILTAAVLSAAATHPEKPLTLVQAWQILPPVQILSAVLRTAVASIDVQPHHQAGCSLDRAELWRHSLAVALISRAAAQRLRTHRRQRRRPGRRVAAQPAGHNPVAPRDRRWQGESL